MRDCQCQVDPAIPDSSFFDQVHQAHADSGNADNNPDVQAMAGMNKTAAFLVIKQIVNQTPSSTLMPCCWEAIFATYACPSKT
jgi:hypothetical protein